MFFLYIFLLLRWHSDVENHEIGTFRVNFLFKKHSNLSKKHFIEEYQCRTTIFVKYIFDNFKIEWLLFLKGCLILSGTVLSQHQKNQKKFLQRLICFFKNEACVNYVGLNDPIFLYDYGVILSTFGLRLKFLNFCLHNKKL